MLGLLLFGVFLQVGWSFGYPAGGGQGVGSYSYSDTSGNRYGGTYGLRDDEVSRVHQNFPMPFNPFQSTDDLFPDFFRNFQMLLQDAFSANPGNQQIAFDAAKKAYDITSNQASQEPNFLRDPFGGFNGFDSGFGMQGFHDDFMRKFSGQGQNAAFAGGAIGPGYRQQIASISPNNPGMPNVNIVNRFAEEPSNGGKHYSVSSSSYASSADINGQKLGNRGAQTIINDNGKVTKYSVHS